MNNCSSIAATSPSTSNVQFPENIAATVCYTDSVDMELVVAQPNRLELSETMYTCALCFGISRTPAMIRGCFHVGCYKCLCRHYEMNLKVDPEQSSQVVYAECPTCRHRFDRIDIIEFPEWTPLSKWAYRSIRVKCSLPGRRITNIQLRRGECSHECSIMDLQNHEQFECPLRNVSCPNYGCEFQGTAAETRSHFYTCDKLARYCETCCLPVLVSESKGHDCISALKGALQNTQKKCTEYCVPFKISDHLGEPGKLCLRYFESVESDVTMQTGTPTNSPMRVLQNAPRRVRVAASRMRNRIHHYSFNPILQATQRSLSGEEDDSNAAL
jgi:hypothetical protein